MNMDMCSFRISRMAWPVLPPPQIQLMSSPSPGAICECNSSRKRAELAQRRSLASLALANVLQAGAARAGAMAVSTRRERLSLELQSSSSSSYFGAAHARGHATARLAYLLRSGSLSGRTGSGSRRSKSKQLFRIGRLRTALLLQAAATHLDSRPKRATTHTKHNGLKNCELG